MDEATNGREPATKSGAPSKKRKVSARELITDIRLGMPNAQLMAKYGLSLERLQNFFRQLEKAKLRCPSCGETRWEKFSECPRCGILVDRFMGAGEPVPVFSADAPPQIVVSGEVADPLRGRTRLIGGLLAGAAAVVIAAGLYWLSLSTKHYQTDIYFNPIRQELVKISRQLHHGITMIEHRKMVTSLSDQVSRLQVKLKGQNSELLALLDESISSLRKAETAWLKENELKAELLIKFHWKNVEELRTRISAYKRQYNDRGMSEHEELLAKIDEAVLDRQNAWQSFGRLASQATSLMDGGGSFYTRFFGHH